MWGVYLCAYACDSLRSMLGISLRLDLSVKPRASLWLVSLTRFSWRAPVLLFWGWSYRWAVIPTWHFSVVLKL